MSFAGAKSATTIGAASASGCPHTSVNPLARKEGYVMALDMILAVLQTFAVLIQTAVIVWAARR